MSCLELPLPVDERTNRITRLTYQESWPLFRDCGVSYLLCKALCLARMACSSDGVVHHKTHAAREHVPRASAAGGGPSAAGPPLRRPRFSGWARPLHDSNYLYLRNC